MKIQKGIVKYKDRDDIVCMYGITDDGKTYYFLDENDEKKFSNGTRVVSTVLKEAVDPMVKGEHIGLVDEEGKEVIPCENRSIRPVNDTMVLVEPATPVTPSVLEAIEQKNDPALATKLVPIPAQIKEKLNEKMGSEGRYVFNDQCSEATVCDIDGNNLINGEYYSFIGLTADKLYFSKNTPDSEIKEHSILPAEVESDIAKESDVQEMNINEVEIPEEVVEESTSSPVVPVTPINAKEGMADIENAVVPTVEEDKEEKEVQEEEAKEETPVEETVEEDAEFNFSVTDDEMDEAEEEINVSNEVEGSSLDDMFGVEKKEEVTLDSNFHVDSIEEEKNYKDVEPIQDTVIVDAARSMSELMKQNRDQRAMIEAYQEQIEKVEASRNTISEKAKMQEQKIEALNSKIRGYETTISKLEAKNQLLETANKSQERTIQEQANELDSLRPQLEGKEELVRILADAQAMLGEEKETYQKVA